jgi:hypothetical protein
METPRDPHAADTTTPDMPARPRAQAVMPLWRRWLPALLGAVAGLALCAAGLGLANVLSPRSPAPDSTARAFCAALAGQHYVAAYGLLSPDQQTQGTAAQFAATQRQLDALRGKITACAYRVESDDDHSAQVTLTLTRESAGTLSASVRLLLVNGAWRVESYSDATVRADPSATRRYRGGVGPT